MYGTTWSFSRVKVSPLETAGYMWVVGGKGAGAGQPTSVERDLCVAQLTPYHRAR